MLNIAPVSYTHLDVYKRQMVLIEDTKFLCDCLSRNDVVACKHFYIDSRAPAAADGLINFFAQRVGNRDKAVELHLAFNIFTMPFEIRNTFHLFVRKGKDAAGFLLETDDFLLHTLLSLIHICMSHLFLSRTKLRYPKTLVNIISLGRLFVNRIPLFS